MKSEHSAPPYAVAAACGGAALAACLAVVHATAGDAYWIVDCAEKALMAERLLETGYRELDLLHPGASLDPGGDAFPIPAPFAVLRDGGFVSQYPPAYPGLAVPFLALLGERGLRWPAALGVAACASLFVIWTAPALGRRWAAAGGLALAMATPLFFYGVTVWEHSITVALPLAAWVALRHSSSRRLALSGLLAAAACWFRAELALMGVALAAAVYERRRRAGDVAMLALGAAPPILGWLAFNGSVFGHPFGVHVALNVGVSEETAAGGAQLFLRRASALLGGVGMGRSEALWLGLTVAGAWVAGALAVRRKRAVSEVTLGALAAGLAASLFGLFQIASAPVPLEVLPRYNGFAVQLPLVCLAGVGAVCVCRYSVYDSLRLGVLSGLGFLLLGVVFRVTLTDFATGGHWGPRMLLPAVPALVALALVALRSQIAEGSPIARALGAGALALLAAGIAASGVATWLLHQQKLEVRHLRDTVLAAPQPVVVTNFPALGWMLASSWGEKPLLYVSDSRSLARVAGAIARQGIGEFLLLYGPPTGRDFGRVGQARCRLAGTYRGHYVRRVFDLERQVCALDRPSQR